MNEGYVVTVRMDGESGYQMFMLADEEFLNCDDAVDCVTKWANDIEVEIKPEKVCVDDEGRNTYLQYECIKQKCYGDNGYSKKFMDEIDSMYDGSRPYYNSVTFNITRLKFV